MLLRKGFTLFMLLFLLAACQSSLQAVSKTATYIIFASHQNEKGEMLAFNEKGKLLGKQRVDARGIDENGSAFLSGPQTVGQMSYLGVNALNNQDFLLQVDKQSLEVIKQPVASGNGHYTGFFIDQGDLFSFYNTPGKPSLAHVTKQPLGKESVTKSETLPNVALELLTTYNKQLFAIAQDTKRGGTIVQTLDRQTLKVIKQYLISPLQGIYAFKQSGPLLYLVPIEGINNSESYQILAYNLMTNETKTINLPFHTPGMITLNQSHLFVAQERRIFALSGVTNIAKINRKTGSVEKRITLDEEVMHIEEKSDELIVVTKQHVYFYHTATLKAKRSFSYSLTDDLMFGSFIIK